MPAKSSQNTDKPIGFFDSGIGGLTVLKEALIQLPYEQYIYFADKKNAPYGIKSREQVHRLVFDAIKTLADMNIKMLVVACNTATSIAIDDLRREYSFPIIGMEPAVKPAVNSNGGGRVLVVATQLTLKETKFKSLVKQVDNNRIVDYLALPRLVEYAEKLEFESDRVNSYITKMLSSVKIERYGTIVLGCTHFVFYRDTFRKLLPERIKILDGNHGTICRLKNVAAERSLLSDKGDGSVEFYSSGLRIIDEASLNEFRMMLDKAGSETGDC